MYRLLFVCLFLFSLFGAKAQSPHGEQFLTNCADCHTAESWEISFDHWEKAAFSHDQTTFPLTGGHTLTDCRFCHETLVFEEAKTSCVSCHEDLHRMTVGSDCARCHSTDNWLVDQITELHQENGFPLLGMHAQISCDECHQSASDLEFTRIGNACINCHREDYEATTSPNHVAGGYSTDCVECHDLAAFGWQAQGTNHDFFPLVRGHDISDCNLCHTNGTFRNTPTDCVACHQDDFNSTSNPNHSALSFSNDCAQCHSLNPDWMPAEYRSHDNDFFPIYSGTHQGEWSDCMDCHQNLANYAEFTCISCHRNPSTDAKHTGVGGYVYASTACLACHPNGDGDAVFDHNRTNFPLTGAHQHVDCNDCHQNGFQGTPTACEACHLPDYQQTTSPNHQTVGFSTDCATCHTTDPNWTPAQIDHDVFYELKGAHALIANDCARCHNSTFTNTPTMCVGCHLDDYNQTTDPIHQNIGFSTDCALCHTENRWDPSTFDHDAMYFPIYSGKHRGEWNQCIDCHTIAGNLTAFSCIDCHEHSNKREVDKDHDEVSGYTYSSSACFSCHPRGD